MRKHAWVSMAVLVCCIGLAGCGEKISVTEATYGLNRGNNQAGNATQIVKAACEGKATCDFAVSDAAKQIGDRFPGLTKDFDVSYVCGSQKKTAHADGEAVGKTVTLTCK